VGAELPEWALLERTVWGSAPCDHLEQMAADAAASWNIRVVVLAFYGNVGTECTRGHDPELLYRWDLARAVDLWLERDVRVVLVVPPGPVDSEPGGSAARAALAVARDREVTLVDTTEDFLDPETGTFVSQLGDEVLRSPDGIHLCDHDELDSTRCPEDAPGAVRFATPIADAAVAQAKLVK
jgi:hypothetical protein